MKNLLDKIKGCLIGGAVGDALGYAVEFMSYSHIVGKYGDIGISKYDLNNKGVAEISDDTQMSLYTANGLLIDDLRTAYLEWYQTQMTYGKMIENPKCWISNVPEMYSRRAPGNTCMSALYNMSKDMPVQNYSKGCGGIMRVAPIALYGAAHNKDINEVAKLGCDAAAMTHQHPLGFLPSGLIVYVLQKIVERDACSKKDLIDAVKEGLYVIEHQLNDDKGTLYGDLYKDEIDELNKSTLHAIKLAENSVDDVFAISQLGEGWVGDEAWYIALYCTLAHFDDFEKAIVAAVNHSGDSDSTGAICGNLMGAIHGYDAIPEHYTQNLELHEVILKMAYELYR